jgi:hypothetical protein
MVTGNISNLYRSQVTNQFEQMRTTFQQLGTDLQSGNVAAAQKDFANLTSSPSTTTPTHNSMSQTMQQLGQDLQSGNVTAAQQDYATIQRALQQHLVHSRHGQQASATSNPTDTPATTDPLSLFKNLAITAASAYGGAGISNLLNAGSALSQVA